MRPGLARRLGLVIVIVATVLVVVWAIGAARRRTAPTFQTTPRGGSDGATTTEQQHNQLVRKVETGTIRVAFLIFYADWCPVCPGAKREFDAAAVECGDRDVEHVRINVDDAPALAAAYHVDSIPQVIALRHPHTVERLRQRMGASGFVADMRRLAAQKNH